MRRPTSRLPTAAFVPPPTTSPLSSRHRQPRAHPDPPPATDPHQTRRSAPDDGSTSTALGPVSGPTTLVAAAPVCPDRAPSAPRPHAPTIPPDSRPDVGGETAESGPARSGQYLSRAESFPTAQPAALPTPLHPDASTPRRPPSSARRRQRPSEALAPTAASTDTSRTPTTATATSSVGTAARRLAAFAPDTAHKASTLPTRTTHNVAETTRRSAPLPVPAPTQPTDTLHSCASPYNSSPTSPRPAAPDKSSSAISLNRSPHH